MKPLFIAIFISHVLFAQTQIYRDALKQALTDSTISTDEKALLESLRLSLDITSDEALSMQQDLRTKWKEDDRPVFNQEGRSWIIYQNMSLGNGLYGNALPYVLGITDSKVYEGLHLLLFAGGYYATSSYTKKMDLPTGRALFQSSGAALGMAGMFTLIPLVGFDHWENIDPDGKLYLTMEMVGAPLGIWQADRWYRKWQPSNGQASLICGSLPLGAFNTWTLYSLITDIPPDDASKTYVENWFRLGIPLTYAGSLASAYYTHKYFNNQSITRGDAQFIANGAFLGIFYWMEIAALLEPDSYRTMMLLGLASVNGAIYATHKFVEPVNLTMGDAGIVLLGSAAAWLAWEGTALLTGVDLYSDMARIFDIASVTAGFYLTFDSIAEKRLAYEIKEKSKTTFSMYPSLEKVGSGKIIPGLGFTISF